MAADSPKLLCPINRDKDFKLDKWEIEFDTSMISDSTKEHKLKFKSNSSTLEACKDLKLEAKILLLWEPIN